MRILAVTNLYPTPIDPIRATFNRQQFRALAEGHDVRVIAPVAWGDELKARLAGRGRIPRDRRGTCDGLMVEYPRFWYPPKVLQDTHGSLFQLSIRRTFLRAVAEFEPDLVLSAWAYPDGWAAVELGHSVGLPVVVKVHGSDILWELQKQPGRLKRTKQALMAADLVVAVSNDLAEKVEALGANPARIAVVYDGVDDSRFYPGPRNQARRHIGISHDCPHVLFVGRLVPVKGLDVLIKACALLAAKGLVFQCHLVGDGPLKNRIDAEVRRSGLERFVRLHGAKPHDELPYWFRAADLFVLPSRSEGLPCVLLEAIACGTPFVASRVGGIPEIAHMGTGCLVESGDADQLANSMASLITSTRKIGVSTSETIRGHQAAAAALTHRFGELVVDHQIRVQRDGLRHSIGMHAR